MKHRILLLLSCILFLQGILKAQDFEPGQQAQGYLDSKNMMVDYSTGIFHYKVPLYTLGSKEFQLPISLDYSANGVKEEDQRGLIGFNWTLNTGGVVTRTIRGGIADETWRYGFIWAEKENDALPLMNDITSVNKHERDGECDIFTAVFNNQSVNFIIQLDANDHVYAEPLERTNVRIECEYSLAGEINGWVVVDENGNRYIYRQKEYTADINKEDAISFNGIHNKSYISSWYLNCIEPRNKKTIIFTYLDEVVGNAKDQPRVNNTEIYSEYKLMFSYGRNMEQRAFYYSSFKKDFDEAIDEAKFYINNRNVSDQLEYELYNFRLKSEGFRYPSSCTYKEDVMNMNLKVMGKLSNMTSISVATNRLVQELNGLISLYEGSLDPGLRMAVSWLRIARWDVLKSLDEKEYISSNEVSGGTMCVIKSPILLSIAGEGKRIEFTYDNLGKNSILKNVKFTDVFEHAISETVLLGEKQINGLNILDKEGNKVHQIQFDYHEKPSSIATIVDAWGYLRPKIGNDDNGYYLVVDDQFSKVGSLKTVTVSDGGELMIDYESNRVADMKFGGIRIKSLSVEDGKNNTSDTIYYRYPKPGVPVFGSFKNKEDVFYDSFSDRVKYSRVKYTNLSFVKNGNNGLYYPYVQEITRGKGTKAFLFHAIRPFYMQLSHAFWLDALPLATAVYDSEGNLKQLVKYKYLSDLVGGRVTNDYFNPIDTTLNYKKSILQVKAYEYYMNKESLEKYYRDQEPVLLYEDCYIHPYNEIYLPNILPRTSVKLPDQVYYIYYGGKTLLEEINEYRFEAHVTDSVSISDFSLVDTGIPYQKIKYFYDNIKGSSYSTRVVKVDSKGNVYTTVTKRVSEMDNSASPVFETMKQKNILEPVIKEIQLKNNVIQKENVSLYEKFGVGDTINIGLSRKYTFYPTSVKTLASDATLFPDVTLFFQGQTNYQLEETIEYQQGNQLFLPVTIRSRSGEEVLCHDSNYGHTILNVKNVKPQNVIAADLKKYNDDRRTQNIVSRMLTIYSTFNDFHEACQEIKVEQQSAKFHEYTRSAGYQMIQDLISVVAAKKNMLFEDFRALVDSVYANNQYYLREFNINYYELSLTKPELGYLRELESKVFAIMFEGRMRDENVFKYRCFPGQQNYLRDTTPVKITALSGSKRLKLFVLTDGTAGSVTYTVMHSGGTSSGHVQCSISPGYSVQGFDLDLSSYENVTSVIVLEPDQNVAYVALLPDKVPFEATSYNLDGTEFCKFDQNGSMELNEYDTAGRLTRVKDGHGNVIKEYQYNVVK